MGFNGGNEEDRAYVGSWAAFRPQATENWLLDLPGEISSDNVFKCLMAAKQTRDGGGDDDDDCNNSSDTACFDLFSLR